jgi:hypothetical protein
VEEEAKVGEKEGRVQGWIPPMGARDDLGGRKNLWRN